MQNFETDQEKIHASSLLGKQVITPDDHQRILSSIEKRTFSLSGETAAFMSAGIMLFSSGLGVLIYNNIDQIGHISIIAGIGAAVVSGLLFSFRKAQGYVPEKAISAGTGYDYMLLVSNILLLTLFQYINFQADVFGDTGAHYLIGGAIVLFNAYYFDHTGVLAVGIGAIAAFFGLRLNAFGLFQSSVSAIAITASLYAIAVELCGLMTERKNVKKHFRFTYVQFSLHLLFVSLIVLISDNRYWAAIPIVFSAAFLWYRTYAKRERSFYLLFFVMLYIYILTTIWIMKMVDFIGMYGDFTIYLFLLYLIMSAILGISYMKKEHKKLKHDL